MKAIVAVLLSIIVSLGIAVEVTPVTGFVLVDVDYGGEQKHEASEYEVTFS